MQPLTPKQPSKYLLPTFRLTWNLLKRKQVKQGNILSFLKPAQAKPEKKGKGKADYLRNQPEKTATKRSAENAELTLDDREQVMPKKPASKRKFFPQWQEEFTWVVFN